MRMLAVAVAVCAFTVTNADAATPVTRNATEMRQIHGSLDFILGQIEQLDRKVHDLEDQRTRQQQDVDALERKVNRLEAESLGRP